MTNNRIHIDFQLNGNSYCSTSELIKAAEFSKKTQQFLSDWFSDNEYITVKTSGSTGKPKSIQLKKEFMKNSAKATSDFFKLKPKTSALCCLPIDFIAGKMMIIRALTLGWHLDIIKPSSHPLKHIKKSFDFCAMVPLQAQNSINKLYQIKTLIIGGGQVSTQLQESLQTISTKVFATYGMTETITHIALKPLNFFSLKFNNPYYKLLPNISISTDNRNCLMIDAPKICEKIIITNDVVNLISKTEFEWKGRFDNVINSGGIKLYPEEIEKKLFRIITQRFFVAGIMDETLGQKLVLIIEGEFDSTTLDKVRKVNQLSVYEIPKQIFFVDKFLQTKTGKVKRNETLKTILP